MRDMMVFEWLFGKRHSERTATNRTTPTYNEHDCLHDCDCDFDFKPHHDSRQSRYTSSSWDDGHYAHEDYWHDSSDDYAHDFDDFDDDF